MLLKRRTLESKQHHSVWRTRVAYETFRKVSTVIQVNANSFECQGPIFRHEGIDFSLVSLLVSVARKNET
jgi:hypothetical protein